MTDQNPTVDIIQAVDAIRTILKSQYHASLAMLRHAIELTPEDTWVDATKTNSPWQIAYHTLFFTHVYLQPTSEGFQPWEHHQAENQYPDAIPGPAIPDSPLPLLPEPYTKAQILEYWNVCDQMVDTAVDAIDILATESGFSWYKVPKLEHQIVNLRHIEHGAAQLADRVRSAADAGVDWVGARR